jgi:alpha-ribazole phosphatase
MKSYRIHLIRHGACAGNLQGRYIGSTDSPLAMESVQALAQLKGQYEYPTAKAYYCSTHSRCRDTLKILYPQESPINVPGLEESDFGQWENKTAAQLQQEDPAFAAWMAGGEAVSPPGGENGAVFMHRVCEAFERLVENLIRSETDSAVLVVPGGVMMTILSAYGLPKAPFYDWMCEPGCGYSLRIMPSLWMRGMVAEVYETLPRNGEKPAPIDHTVVDLAREAADRAYGRNDDGENISPSEE